VSCNIYITIEKRTEDTEMSIYDATTKDEALRDLETYQRRLAKRLAQFKAETDPYEREGLQDMITKYRREIEKTKQILSEQRGGA